MVYFNKILLVIKWWKYSLLQLPVICLHNISVFELTNKENKKLIRLPEVIVEWGPGKKSS